MSYLTQMLGLTVQNFVSAATGMADAGRPRSAGFARRIGGHDRQLLGRPDPEHALHPAAALVRARARPGLPGRGPDLRAVREGRRRPADRVRRAGDRTRTASPSSTPRGSRKTTKSTLTEQVLALGPAASQVAIKQLGTNGGGFFNVNSAHPVREPDAALELPRAPGDPAHPGRPLLHVRGHGGRHPAGLGRPRRDDRRLRRPPRPSAWWPSSAATTPRLARRRSRGERPPGRAATWRARRPASASRLGPVGHRDDRRLQRLRQLHARLLHAARRARPDVADAARRGDLRRRGLGPLRHADLRHHRRLRGRAHGGPDARVPREEDRGVRDEDGLARHPDPARGGAHRHRGRGGTAGGTATIYNPGPTASARCCTRSPRPATTTAARSPGSAPTTPSTTRRSGWRCSSRATGSPSRPSPSPGRWRRKKTVPAGAGTLPTHTPLFVVLLIGVVAPRRGAHLHPGAGARTDRRAPHHDRRRAEHSGNGDRGASMATDSPKHASRSSTPPIVRRAVVDAFAS